MRMSTLAGAAVIAVAALGASGAMAQSAPSWGSVTCSQFNAMSGDQQAAIAAQIQPGDVAKSITSNSGSGSGMTNDAQSPSATNNVPVPVGSLVAACQASSTLTLHDVVSQPGAVTLPAGD